MVLEKDMNGEDMGRALIRYMDDRPELIKMGKKARKISNVNAAEIIVDQITEMVISA